MERRQWAGTGSSDLFKQLTADAIDLAFHHSLSLHLVAREPATARARVLTTASEARLAPA